jgi:hypothetical protein
MNNVILKNSTVLSKWSSRFLLGMGLVTAMTTASAAVIESESNGTFATADFADPGLNSGVIGDLSAASSDVDIWKFDLTAGAGFGVSISNGPGVDFSGFDPIIVLFKEDAGSYRPVAANDPFAFSTSFGFTPWESGTYFLTVSGFQNSPQDAFGNNQFDSQFWTDQSITGTTFSLFQSEVPGQQGSFVSFDYNLSLNGTVATSPVPVPAAAWLFASGLFGLVGMSRRKQNKV